MKREHLYRGKRLDNREWAQGNFVLSNGRSYIVKEVAFNDEWEAECGSGVHEWIEVLTETVGEFTGEFDKNEIKIFEDDIASNTNVYGLVISVILFANGKFVYKQYYDKYHKWLTTEGCVFDLRNMNRRFEIIGNIHDNLELVNP